MKKHLLLFLVLVGCLALQGQTPFGITRISLPGATTLPTSCEANREVFIDTDATPAGQQLFLCNSSGNGFNLVGDGSVGGATIEISILDSDAIPDTSGNVFSEPFTIAATNDNWRRMVWVFNDTGTTRDCLHGGFLVPQDYSTTGTASFNVVWSSDILTNDIEWDLDYRGVGGNDTESFDQATEVESLNANDTAPSAAWERLEIALGITETNLAAGDDAEFFLCRDKSDSGDTLVGNAYLFRLIFSYTN